MKKDSEKTVLQPVVTIEKVEAPKTTITEIEPPSALDILGECNLSAIAAMNSLKIHDYGQYQKWVDKCIAKLESVSVNLGLAITSMANTEKE